MFRSYFNVGGSIIMQINFNNILNAIVHCSNKMVCNLMLAEDAKYQNQNFVKKSIFNIKFMYSLNDLLF